jgi:hypothetical protein
MSQWLELEIDLQELLLDEIEKVAADPPKSIRTSFVRDFVVNRSDGWHYIFFEFTIDWRAASFTVTGVHLYIRR